MMDLTWRFLDILIRWRIYIEECGLRGLCKQTRDFSLPEFKSEGRIDVGSFLNLADLIWGELLSLSFRVTWITDTGCLDIERTYEPHTFTQVPWIENWFLAQVFASHITDFGLETRHFRTGVAKDNPVPAVPDTVLAKLVVMFEAKLRRKKEAKLIPLVPRKPSVEPIKKTSANKLRKRPSALILHSHSSQPQPQPSSSRPGTPTSQNSDTQAQRQPNRLRKRSRSLTRSSPEPTQQSLPPRTPPPSAQVQGSEGASYRPTVRAKLGPPPSPSNGKRFGGRGVPRRSLEKSMRRSSQASPPSPPLRGAKLPLQDWEII